MSDIYGRSVSRVQPGVTVALVKKLIRDATVVEVKKIIEKTLNLVEVDPGKIVIFAEAQTGKLKTSNISINDILTRQQGATEGVIATFTNDGTIKPDKFLSDNIENQRKLVSDYTVKFDKHEVDYFIYKMFLICFFGPKLINIPHLDRIRKSINIVDIFFGKDIIKPDDIKFNHVDIQRDITNVRALLDGIKLSSVEDIDTLEKINPLVGRFLEESPLSTMKRLVDIISDIDVLRQFNKNTNESLTDLKTAVAVVNNFFGKNINLGEVAMLYSGIIERLSEHAEIKKSIDRVKIPHLFEDIKNVIYVVQHGFIDWIIGGKLNDIFFSPTISGVYRFSVVSQSNFNVRHKTTIERGERLVSTPYSKYAINTAIRNISKDENWNIEVIPIDTSIVREIFMWTIEFIIGIPDA